MRDEAEEAAGARSSTSRRYNDAVLAHGSPPVRFVRELMFDLPIRMTAGGCRVRHIPRSIRSSARAVEACLARRSTPFGCPTATPIDDTVSENVVVIVVGFAHPAQSD